MLIENLPHFESASEHSFILGAAGTAVLATAGAFGNLTATSTKANSMARVLPNGGSRSIGRGFSFARGDISSAQVITAGFGDIVVGSTHSTPDIASKPV
ncbi:MAG TPA: hypothetical protein V6C57_08420, partial [Coleofasciculaceae cyanobacterium]